MVVRSTPMVAVILLGILGSLLTSYTRARAEGLGIDAQVGMLPRPDRIVLLSAPQAFIGLALNGWVLIAICLLLTVTAWITVVQRMVFVYRVTEATEHKRPVPGRTPILRPATSGESDSYDARGVVPDNLALAGDRLVRHEDGDARLADVAAPSDAAARRPEPGHPSSFDRAR